VFEATKSTESTVDEKVLNANICELTLENDFFRKRAYQGGIVERKALIAQSHELPVSKQAKILRMVRSTAYYKPVRKLPCQVNS
jgi:putative transposase